MKKAETLIYIENDNLLKLKINFMENVFLKNKKIMILVIFIAVLVWFIWGALFDPEEKLGPVEKVIRHPRRCTKNLLTKWIKDAEDVLKDPNSTEEQRKRAMKDIEYFSDFR